MSDQVQLPAVEETSLVKPENDKKVVSTALTKKKTKRRPARVQKEPGTVEDQLPQSGTVFNIWYLKWYVLQLSKFIITTIVFNYTNIFCLFFFLGVAVIKTMRFSASVNQKAGA